MKKEGLLSDPKFDNTEFYLQSGHRTEISKSIQDISDSISGSSDGMIVRNILVWINQNTKRLHNNSDSRKFKRSADEILQSGERTGCCDSSTLFTALARSKNIPTMQVITLDKEWAQKISQGINTSTSGHYFTACYLTDINGNSNWILIDTDRPVYDYRDVHFSKLNQDDRNIGRNFYAFAYARDYGDICANGLNIDSIENMSRIQLEAYKQCDKSDLSYDEYSDR